MSERPAPSKRPKVFWLGLVAFAALGVVFVRGAPHWLEAMLMGASLLLLGWTNIHHPESFFSGGKVRRAWPPLRGEASLDDQTRIRLQMRRNGYGAVGLGALVLLWSLVLAVRAI